MEQCYDNCELRTNAETLRSYKNAITNARENSTIQLFSGKTMKINLKLFTPK